MQTASGTAPAGFLTGRVLLGCLACLLLFVVGLSATMGGPEKYHVDETFYTDAAMQMCAGGDYWTPTYPNGGIRLHKPILTYWAIASSFHMFGVTLFASRLPALAAGACLLAATFFLGRTVFQSARAGWLSALITASNVEVMRLMTRATPDVFTCLFVVVSLCGFARIWFEDDRSFWGPLLAFGGIGLAVQTKGLLGLTPLLANILFFVLARPKPSGAKALWSPLALVIGLALAGFWYAVMIQRHGPGALRAFSEDQVGSRLSASPIYLLVNPLFYLGTVLQYFPVWTLILLAGVISARGAWKEFWLRNRSEFLFLLSLIAVVIVIFSFGNIRRARYLAVAYPLASCALAGAISALANGEVLQRWTTRLGLGIGGLLVAAGLFLSIAGLWFDVRLVIGGVLWLAVGVAGVIAARSASMVWRWAWVAGVFMVGFVAHGACFRPVLSPSPLPALTREILALHPKSDAVYVLGKYSQIPGIIRILSGGKLKADEISTLEPSGTSPGPSLVVASDPEPLKKAGYSVRQIQAHTALPQSIVGPRGSGSTCWLGIKQR